MLSVFILLFLLCSCQKGEEAAGYYSVRSLRKPLTAARAISLGDYAFVSFLERGLIEVSAEQDGNTFFGVMDEKGTLVVPALYTSIEMEGDFLLATGNLENSLYTVFNRKGEILYRSDSPLSIQDVGEGCVAIADSGAERSYVISDKREDLLGAALDQTYRYSVCGDYIVAQSTKRYKSFVFERRTGGVLLSFYGSSTLQYDVAYMGGKDFIVLRNEVVSSEKDCTVALRYGDGYYYLKQTVTRYTIGVSTPRTLVLGKHISSVSDRYSFGVTQEAREVYPLKEGYYSVSYYKTEGKVADGSFAYYLGDSSLKEVKTLPEQVSPYLSMVEGIAAVDAPSGNVYLVNDKLDLLAVIEDAVYQNVVYSGGVLTVSKVVNGERKIGGFDLSGREVIPFEYNYISEFVGGKAVATKGGKAYIVDSAGNALYLTEKDYPMNWDGFYEKEQNGKIGLCSFSGSELLSVSFDALCGVKRYGGEVFVALSQGNDVRVYRLF